MNELFDVLFGVLIGLGVYHYYYLSIDKTVNVHIPQTCIHLPDKFTSYEYVVLKLKEFPTVAEAINYFQEKIK